MGEKPEKGITLILVLLLLIGAYLAYTSYDYSRDMQQLINKVVEKDTQLEARIKRIEKKTGVR